MPNGNQKTPENTQMPALQDYNLLYEKYALWKSLPIMAFKKMSAEQIMTEAGIDDEEVLDLLTIRTQTEFGERYDLNKDTLTAWNKKIKTRDPLVDIQAWATMLTRNMIMLLYLHAARKGEAGLFKLFFEVVNKWNPKMIIAHEVPVVARINISLYKKPEIKNATRNDGPTSARSEGDGSRMGDVRETGGSVRLPYRSRN